MTINTSATAHRHGKDLHLKLEMRNSLSRKLLRVVLLSALAVGLVLSCAQIIFGAYKTRQLIEADAQRILRMTRDPSTQAIYSLDREMGAQVMEGLFQHESIRMASIGHPDEGMLALKIRPPISLPTRWLTDPILHQDRQFSIPLIGKPPYNEYYGELRITLDTAQYGREFVNDSIVIFIVGILRALTLGLVLFLIYQWLLTRPLTKLIEHGTDQSGPPRRAQTADDPEDMSATSWASGWKPPTACWPPSSTTCICARSRESSLHRMTQYDS